MRKIVSTAILLIGIVIGFAEMSSHAGEMDILVNKLVDKGILTPVEGQMILAEAQQELATEMAQAKSPTAPEWTQKIKVQGDVRLRNQWETAKSSSSSDDEKARFRQRVRARIGIDGTINDQLSGGVRLATGSDNDGRSTNQTLGDSGTGKGYFTKWDLWIDQAYLKWEPKIQYLDRTTVWGGKFINPFRTTAMTWDGDINPEGMVVQYAGPTWSNYNMPDISFGLNGGWMWLDYLKSNAGFKGIWGIQGTMDFDLKNDWGTKFKTAFAYFNPTNLKNKPSPSYSADTNSVIGSNYQYDLHWFDMLFNLDNKSIMDWEINNGLWLDMALNPSVSKDRFAMSIGAYLGDKKVGKKNQWKVYGEYRRIERDAVPDFLPDSDFIGYTLAGDAKGGGTNGQGFVVGCDYGLLNNTVLGLKWYWTEPITSTTSLDEPFNLVQLDIITKF
ncbi:MAG: putative porin [Candidatus Omnitrophica bacterium]|nr:putative porin [Candidatus Omnitrophota bacterium]